jgi:chaperonin GroES
MSLETAEGTLVPLYDQVLVRESEEEEGESGGIIIPSTVKTKQDIGEVVAIGEGRLMPDGNIIPLKVQVGDVVVLKDYTGTDVSLDGVTYKFVREDDLVGVIRG